MNILLTIVYLLSAALLVWFVYWSFKNPDHFLLLDNKYRMMVKIRDCYLKGLKAQPQDSEEYFQRKAAKIIEDYEPVFGHLKERRTSNSKRKLSLRCFPDRNTIGSISRKDNLLCNGSVKCTRTIAPEST